LPPPFRSSALCSQSFSCCLYSALQMHHRHIALQLIPLPTATCVQKHQNIILMSIRVSHSVFLVVQVRLLTLLESLFNGAVISNQYYLTITRNYWKRSNSVSPTWWVKCTNILLTKCWVAQNMYTWGINGRYCTKKKSLTETRCILQLNSILIHVKNTGKIHKEL